MSNFLAIAAVTAGLRKLVGDAIREAVPGTDVTTQRPDAAEIGSPRPRVNVFLYQIVPNASWRNADLPTRRGDGMLTQRPQAALDLHYLLSFFGDEEELEPQRLLGSTISALHAQPVLTREAARAAIAAGPGTFLANADLAEQQELVRFSPMVMNLEELSKLWSVFFQAPYVLSIAYQASVVLLEAGGDLHPALPVRARELYVGPFRPPLIEHVMSQTGREGPILAGQTLSISGRHLRGEVTQVRIGGIEVIPQEVSDTQVSLTLSSPPLPAGTLRPGVQAVQVVHQSLLGRPPTPHRGGESNVVAFVLRPTVTAVSVSNLQGSGNSPRSADLNLQLDPTIGKGQRVLLILNELAGAEAAGYTFLAPPRDVDVSELTIPISGVRAAEYLLRVQVDGAEGPLEVDGDPNSATFNQYVGPKVTIA